MPKSSSRRLAQIAAELLRLTTELREATQLTMQTLAPLPDCTEYATWQRAAASVEALAERAAATSIAAATAGSNLMIEVVAGASKQQRERLSDAIGRLQTALSDAGEVMASALLLPWPEPQPTPPPSATVH